jgi:hypothetical protein
MQWFKFLTFRKNKVDHPVIVSTLIERSHMLSDLAGIPDGQYSVSWWKSLEYAGWLTIDREKDGNTSVMWTTGKDTHNPLAGCSRLVRIRPNGSLQVYFESAITMWITWGYGRGNDDDLRTALEFAEWAQSYLIETRK